MTSSPQLAVGQHCAGLGIDDLGVEVVLPDVEAVLAFDAFDRDARADGLGAAVYVDRLHVEAGLDLLAHRLGPWFGAVNADLQRAAPRVQPQALELIGDRKHVGRRHGNDPGLEVADHPDLTLGEPARRRDHGAAQFLGAAVEAETAGEEPVAVGDVHHVARPRAGGAQAAGHEAGPHVEVGPRVAHDGGDARGAARGMDADNTRTGHRKQVEGIVEAEIILDRERELGQVVEGLEIGRAHAGIVETPLVVGDIVVGMPQSRPQPRELQCRDFVAARGLDRIEFVRSRGADGVVHGVPPAVPHHSASRTGRTARVDTVPPGADSRAPVEAAPVAAAHTGQAPASCPHRPSRPIAPLKLGIRPR